MRCLIAEVPPQVAFPAIRVALALLSGAVGALGLRRGGHNFLQKLVTGLVLIPRAGAGAIERIIHGAHAGAAEDALQQQYTIAGYYTGLAHAAAFASFTVRYLAQHTLHALRILT